MRNSASQNEFINRKAVPLAGSPNEFDSVLNLVGGAHVLFSSARRVMARMSYRPETELASHYFHARLSEQFDGVLHYDHTRAVEPLERTAEWQTGEVEEIFPSGL